MENNKIIAGLYEKVKGLQTNEKDIEHRLHEVSLAKEDIEDDLIDVRRLKEFLANKESYKSQYIVYMILLYGIIPLLFMGIIVTGAFGIQFNYSLFNILKLIGILEIPGLVALPKFLEYFKEINHAEELVAGYEPEEILLENLRQLENDELRFELNLDNIREEQKVWKDIIITKENSEKEKELVRARIRR